MKKIFMVLVLSLMLLSPLVVSSEFPILDKQGETRKAHFAWLTAVQEVRMQGAIEYINTISSGQGTSGLSTLVTDFQDQSSTIQTFTTHVALDVAIQQLQQTATRFRTEMRSQMTAYHGMPRDLQNQVQTTLNGNATMLTALENTYWETRETNELFIFDTRVTRA